VSESPTSVLSFASSIGVEAVELQARFGNAVVTAYDIDPSTIARAKLMFKSHCNCKRVPIRFVSKRQQLQNRSFDIVLANHVVDDALSHGFELRRHLGGGNASLDEIPVLLNDIVSLVREGGFVMVSGKKFRRYIATWLWRNVGGHCVTLGNPSFFEEFTYIVCRVFKNSF